MPNKSSRARDLTGQRFGKLTVLYQCDSFIGKTGRKYAQWMTQCDCGNYKVVRANCLYNGHTQSCGCNRIQDLTGKRFGKLTVLSFFGYAWQPSGIARTMWLAQCDCGEKTVVSHGNIASGHTTSCGCLRCSAQESLIKHVLNERKINHIKEYTFSDFKSKTSNRFFRFDFGLLDNDNNLLALLEYQGSQHFIETPGFEDYGAGQRNFTDALKRKYCKEHNIPLYEITYLEDTETELNHILSIVYGNTVPSTQLVA